MYKTLCELDFFSDEVLRQKLTKLSLGIVIIPAFVLGIFLGLDASGVIAYFAEFSSLSMFTWLVLLALCTLVALPVHELIHALCFKLFCPKTHIIFGFKDAMLFAGCPGEVFAKAEMCTILLAPAVVLSTLFVILAFTTGAPLLCLASAVLHLSGCSGDIIATKIVLSEPNCTHCEDTDSGMRLLTALQ